MLKGTLKLLKSKLGEDHPTTLTAQNTLAAAYASAGQMQEATPLFEQTLKQRELRLGPEHPHTLDSRANMASVYLLAGRYDEATPLIEQGSS